MIDQFNAKYPNILFLNSVADLESLPTDSGAEIAFAGRSNSGKSTAINAITGINKLARTSKTPGRTQLINFFQLTPERRLVDLPGYGYAKVPEQVKLDWQELLTNYFAIRKSLRGIVLLMDIRHPLKPFDWQMLEWATYHRHRVHILLAKSDKLKRGAASRALLEVRRQLKGYEDLVSVQLFSALHYVGIDEARLRLDFWF